MLGRERDQVVVIADYDYGQEQMCQQKKNDMYLMMRHN